MWKRSELIRDLAALGVRDGDLLMVHASLRAVGRVMGGADAVIDALREAIGVEGTLCAYLDWDAPWQDLIDDDGATLLQWREAVLPFDPVRTRAARANGWLAEAIRTTPGALRSGNPGASVAAVGPRAAWLTADHPLDYGYGPGSPFAKLVEGGGRVLMLGAPRDTMTLVHHAEHLARIAGKRVERAETPLLESGSIVWRWIEEYDTSEPVSDRLPEDFIAQIVTAFVEAGLGRTGHVGAADCVLVDAPEMLPFAVDWIERMAG